MKMKGKLLLHFLIFKGTKVFKVIADKLTTVSKQGTGFQLKFNLVCLKTPWVVTSIFGKLRTRARSLFAYWMYRLKCNCSINVFNQNGYSAIVLLYRYFTEMSLLLQTRFSRILCLVCALPTPIFCTSGGFYTKSVLHFRIHSKFGYI